MDAKDEIVCVLWVDSAFHFGKWSPDKGLVLNRSLGFLVGETKEHIAVAQSQDTEEGTFQDVLVIPKSQIVARSTDGGSK